MIDIEKNLQELSRLEAHVAWVRQNFGNGPVLDRHLAEISKIRGAIAAAAPTKCQLVQRPE
jgi:hypothetical protein